MIRQLPGGGPPRRRSDIATRRYVEAQLKRGGGGGGAPPTGTAGGDLAGTYPNPSLAAILAAGGPTGGPTTVPVITWDAKGRLTVVSTTTIVGPFPPNGAAGGDLSGNYPNPTLAGILAAGGPTGSATVVPVITWDAKGRLTAVSTATIVGPFPPNGTAGGDLAGTYPNPTVAQIHGIAYSADPLAQYVLLAGRGGGQVVFGGTALGDALNLFATANTTLDSNSRGPIVANDEIQLFPTAQTYATRSPVTGILAAATVITLSGGNSANILSAVTEFRFTASPFFFVGPQLFNSGVTVRAKTNNVSIDGCRSFRNAPNLIADGVTWTMSGNGPAFDDAAALSVVGTGAFDAAATYKSFVSRPIVAAGATLVFRTGFEYDASSNTTHQTAFTSNLGHSSGFWFLLDTGGADSAFVGGLRLGDNSAPNFKLDVRGGAGFGQRTVTNANATIANSDFLVSMSTGNTNQTATLPAAAPGNTGMVVTIVKTDAGTGTVTVSTVVGGNKVITANQGRGAVFQSDGAGWYMVAGNL